MNLQQAILDFIIAHNLQKGYSPTIREIGEAVGLKSSSTTYGHIERLEKRGFIRRKSSSPRTIEVLSSANFSHSVEVVEESNGLPVAILFQGRKYIYVPLG